MRVIELMLKSDMTKPIYFRIIFKAAADWCGKRFQDRKTIQVRWFFSGFPELILNFEALIKLIQEYLLVSR